MSAGDASGIAPFPRGRLLAVDWGDRRIGLALSDELGMIASPAGVIERRAGKRPPLAELARRATEAEARGLVFGLPLDGAGEDTPRAAEVRAIAVEMARRTGLPVRLVDERFTTAAALRTIRDLGGSTRGRKGDVDAMAAAILLQHALAMGAALDAPPAPDASRAGGADAAGSVPDAAAADPSVDG